ncbi:MAG TPA: hypothetical protein PL131_13555 [Methylotenera sp.]|nr:hypothetical protein [Methylotenera sp.]HPH06891.1 hypothetical protein [Methylotenera sp.]HPM48731.1 hypothetical protein [Methylotenera sp.]
MFKLTKVQNEYWWVPESNPYALAVKIADEDSYRMAIRDKLETLIEKDGLKDATETARMTLEEAEARAMEKPQSAEHLAIMLMDRTDIGEMIRMGSPWRSDSATQEEAEEAVKAQDELSLADFLD